MKTFVSWSGGKDSALACYLSMRDKKLEVACFLNMVCGDGKHSRTHGVGSELLRLQAEISGVPIVQRKTGWDAYEEEFKCAVCGLKKENIHTGVFGDIDLEEHRDWVERVCGEAGIEPIFPLWKKKREEILEEFMDLGFEAVVVAARAEVLGKEWIGRKIDGDFIKELRILNNVDLCGEAGEYHTFVYAAPFFKKKIEIFNTKKIRREANWFLDILDYRTMAKIK